MDETKKRYHVDIGFWKSPLMLDSLIVYQICDLACSSDLEVFSHRQPCHEISYIVSGTGEFYRNGRAYPVEPGMLFLVSKNDEHRILSSKTDPLRYICVGFNFNRGHASFARLADISRFFDSLTEPLARDRFHADEPLTAALSEITGKRPFSDEMFRCHLTEALILTYRSFFPAEKGPGAVRTDDAADSLVHKIVAIIDSDLSSLKRLDEIAERLGYSYSYLSRLFSSTMGLTVREYYTERRMKKAVELLSQGLPLWEIAEKLSFADEQSFSKSFRKFYRVPPGEYRKRTE